MEFQTIKTKTTFAANGNDNKLQPFSEVISMATKSILKTVSITDKTSTNS